MSNRREETKLSVRNHLKLEDSDQLDADTFLELKQRRLDRKNSPKRNAKVENREMMNTHEDKKPYYIRKDFNKWMNNRKDDEPRCQDEDDEVSNVLLDTPIDDEEIEKSCELKDNRISTVLGEIRGPEDGDFTNLRGSDLTELQLWKWHLNRRLHAVTKKTKTMTDRYNDIFGRLHDEEHDYDEMVYETEDGEKRVDLGWLDWRANRYWGKKGLTYEEGEDLARTWRFVHIGKILQKIRTQEKIEGTPQLETQFGNPAEAVLNAHCYNDSDNDGRLGIVERALQQMQEDFSAIMNEDFSEYMCDGTESEFTLPSLDDLTTTTGTAVCFMSKWSDALDSSPPSRIPRDNWISFGDDCLNEEVLNEVFATLLH